MSDVDSLSDGDVHERLLRAGSYQYSPDESEQQDVFTHEKLMHSIGSFSAVVWPVAVTMLFARCVFKPCKIQVFSIVLNWDTCLIIVLCQFM